MPHGRRDELQAHLSALELAVDQLPLNPMEAASSVHRVAGHIVRLAEELGILELADAAGPLSVAEQNPSEEDLARLQAVLRLVIQAEDRPLGAILIVDDDRVSARLLQAKLTSTNRTVLIAESVLEAETIMGGERLGLIILDLFLPDGDGRNLLIDLRSRRHTEDVPVVVLSGNTSPLARSECIALGANAFVEKPFNPDEVVTTVMPYLLRGGEGHDNHSTHHTRQEPKEHRPARVLLAEDDPVTARLISHRLEREGFEVVHRTDGPAALAEAKQGGFGLILLDVKMPGMDGFEILGRLRDVEHDHATPVVMLTAMGKEEDVVRAFQMGANDYVLKPFSPVELTARVRRLVSPG